MGIPRSLKFWILPCRECAYLLDPHKSDYENRSHLEKLQRKIEHLEFSLRSQIETAIQLRSAIQGWDQEMALVAVSFLCPHDSLGD